MTKSLSVRFILETQH